MWLSFNSGWLFLLVPLAFMFVCILMCVLGCRPHAGGCTRCCGHRDSGDERRS